MKKPKPNTTTENTGSSNAPPAPSRAKLLSVSFDSGINITDDFDDNDVASPPSFEFDPHLSSATTTSTPPSPTPAPPPAAPPAQVIPPLQTPITPPTENNEYHYTGTPLPFKASFHTPTPTSNTIVLSQQEYMQLIKDSQVWQVKYAGVASEAKALREQLAAKIDEVDYLKKQLDIAQNRIGSNWQPRTVPSHAASNLDLPPIYTQFRTNFERPGSHSDHSDTESDTEYARVRTQPPLNMLNQLNLGLRTQRPPFPFVAPPINSFFSNSTSNNSVTPSNTVIATSSVGTTLLQVLNN